MSAEREDQGACFLRFDLRGLGGESAAASFLRRGALVFWGGSEGSAFFLRGARGFLEGGGGSELRAKGSSFRGEGVEELTEERGLTCSGALRWGCSRCADWGACRGRAAGLLFLLGKRMNQEGTPSNRPKASNMLSAPHWNFQRLR